MKQKSWHLNRRELLKGGGVALALPLLNGMSWARERPERELPKRMVVSYFAYGAYMPNGTARHSSRRTSRITNGAGGRAQRPGR